MNIFSSEIVQQKSAWLNCNIPQEIERIVLSYCDLADLNSLYQTCKRKNSIDTLICPTHKQKNHECSSIHLSDLTKDYDRCTYILHCLANRINLTNPVKFNSQLEKNLFNMIYFLHSGARETLIQKEYPNLKQGLFTNKIRRDYYQYTQLNSNNMLLKAIEQNKFIRVKQILQSSNRYIKKIITTIDFSLINVINNIVWFTKSVIESQNMIELLLSTDNDTNTTEQHNLWQEIVLAVYKNNHKHKKALIGFLLSKKFDYLNPYFSADFYTKKNGFLSFCSETDFNLISDRYDKETIFDPKEIKCMNEICKITNSKLSIKIVEWLISKKVKLDEIPWDKIYKAYKANKIELVKLLLNQGINYRCLLFKICNQKDIDLATWILDNCNKNNNFLYNTDFIYIACHYLNVEIVNLLFTKKMPIDFYKSYSVRDTLFQHLLDQGYDRTSQEYREECCEIIKLFLKHGFDVDKKWNYVATYRERMLQNNQLAALLPKSNLTNIEKFPTNNRILNIFFWIAGSLSTCLGWYLILSDARNFFSHF